MGEHQFQQIDLNNKPNKLYIQESSDSNYSSSSSNIINSQEDYKHGAQNYYNPNPLGNNQFDPSGNYLNVANPTSSNQYFPVPIINQNKPPDLPPPIINPHFVQANTNYGLPPPLNFQPLKNEASNPITLPPNGNNLQSMPPPLLINQQFSEPNKHHGFPPPIIPPPTGNSQFFPKTNPSSIPPDLNKKGNFSANLPPAMFNNPPKIEKAPFIPKYNDTNPVYSNPMGQNINIPNYKPLNQSIKNTPKLDKIIRDPFENNYSCSSSESEGKHSIEILVDNNEKNLENNKSIKNDPKVSENIVKKPKTKKKYSENKTEMEERASVRGFHRILYTSIKNPNPELELGNIYFKRFIANFPTMIINKTCCEKFFCVRETDIYKLTKLKNNRTLNSQTELIEYISSRSERSIQIAENSCSIIDLYMMCSLLENDNLMVFLKKIDDFVNCISRITTHSIDVLRNEVNRPGALDIKTIFFERTRNFIVTQIRNSMIVKFSQFSLEELSRLLSII